jgi:hypothetical protein
MIPDLKKSRIFDTLNKNLNLIKLNQKLQIKLAVFLLYWAHLLRLFLVYPSYFL